MSKAYLIASLLVYFAGLLAAATYKRQTRTEEEYFLAGRAMPAWCLGLAFIASWYGGNSALISTDEAFLTGLASWWILGGPTLIAVAALLFLAPAIRRVRTLSQNGIMGARYNETTGVLLSVVLTIYLIVWGASQMVAIGHFFAASFGIGFTMAVIIGTVVSLVYATFGGFRAVVLTEAIQFAFLLAGLVVTTLAAVMLSGGFDEIGQAAQEAHDPGYFNFFGGIVSNLAYIISFGLAFTIDGAAWQRIQAAQSPRAARRTALTALVGFIPLYSLVVITGIASVAVFNKVPDGGIVWTLASEHMPPILGIVVFVGVAAAIMSTICTTLNLGSLYMTELLVKYLHPRASERSRVRYGMADTLVVATIGFMIAVRLPSALKLLALASEILAAGLFVPLIFGFFWRRGTAAGAGAAIVFGGGFVMYGFAAELGMDLPVFWQEGASRILIGVAISFVCYVVVSLVTKPDYARADAFQNRAHGPAVISTSADAYPPGARSAAMRPVSADKGRLEA